MELMEIDPSRLVIHVVIVSLSAVGVLELLKNWVCPKKKSMYALLGVVLVAANVSMQIFVSPKATSWYNLFMLGVATMQFAYSLIVKTPSIILGKALGIKPEEAKEKANDPRRV